MRILKNRDALLRKAKGKMEESAEKTEEYARNPGKLERLIESAKHKLMNMENRRHTLKNVARYLGVFIRMVRDSSKGHYPHLPWKSLLSIVGSILYFINPFDVVPDFIPGVGLIDDITLLAWVYKNIESDVEDYLDWEYEHAS